MGDGQIYAWLVEMGKSGHRYALEGDDVTIGRGTACEIRLSDPKVSRSHARVVLESGEAILEDLRSAHGVWVNGQKIDKIKLADGDKIQLGDTHFVLEIEQDSIGTIMVPATKRELAQKPCRYCESPISESDAYCSSCGSLARELPEPFDFIQQAYLQLRALHQSGKMDAATFRAELEKMIVADGAGGYWMVGLKSGRWHWFNGSDWIQREPPSTPLKQAPLVDAQAPPPPASPPPEPALIDAEEGQRTRRLFLIGGGTLVAFSILAIGAYAAYQLINADGEAPIAEAENQPPPISTIAVPEPTQTTAEAVSESPSITPTSAPESPPTEAPSLPFSLRPYDPTLDENLSNLVDFATFLEADSSPEHAIYEGAWYVQQPALFNIGWCAIDEGTLNENLQVIQMSLEIDGRTVGPESMFEDEFGDTDLACRSSRIVVEFLEPGEHQLLWTTSYEEPIFDGWQALEAGTYLNEYVFEIRDSISIVDEFEVSDGTWFETKQTNFDQWIEDGVFNILVHKENFFTWSLYNDLEVDDVFILTDVKRISGVEGAYGIVFRLQDVNNFYYFLVDDSGYFTLGKRLEGEWIPLIDWTVSDAILSGDAFNSLGVVINGDELVVYVNLELVGQVVDDTFANGGVGVAAQSIETTGEMHAIFDVFSLDYYQ